MVARAVSTIIGTLFFVMIASMLILLIIRSLYIYGELASKLRNVMETRDLSSDLTIQVSYSKLEPVTASTVTTVEVLQGHAINVDPTLLDSQDGCIEVEAEGVSIGGDGGQIQLIRNGDFSEGLAYWSYAGNGFWGIRRWGGNPAAYYRYWGTEDTASIWQDFTLSSTVTSASLSFSYAASIIWGAPTRFELNVSIIRGGEVVWSKSIDLLSVPSDNPSYDISNALSMPGSYVLRFDIDMQSEQLVFFTFTLDDVSLTAQMLTPPTPPGAAYVVLIGISIAQIGLDINGTLILRFNNTVNLKIFTWTGDGWRLSEEYIGLPGQWFSVPLSEESLLQAYASTPFLAELDYLALTAEVMANVTTLIAVNEGEGSTEVYAAWLRNSTWEARVAQHAVLFPGQSMTFQFNTALTPGCVYEARVITSTRVFSKIIRP